MPDSTPQKRRRGGGSAPRNVVKNEGPIEKQINHFGSPAPRRPTDAALLASFSSYLCTVARDCSKLLTRGIDLGSDFRQASLRLAQVYVSLETTSPRPLPEGRRRESGHEAGSAGNLSALEALLNAESRQVVLVGEPGSGKSTFFQYVTLWLAAHFGGLKGKASPVAGSEPPELLTGIKAVPLRIVLREFAPRLAAADSGTSEQVVSHLVMELTQGSHTKAAEHLRAVLERGLAFVLFDGLDEVPPPLLPRVRQAIEAFARGDFQKCRVAVTCREVSYRLAEFRLDTFPDPHEIAPLSAELQARFVRAWYEELEIIRPEFKGEGSGCGITLIEALRSENLEEMAGNPFFLTAMAALHRPDKPLPNTGAKLMDDLVKGVLEESRKVGAEKDSKPGVAGPQLALLLQKVYKGAEVLRACLEEIAFEARVDRVLRRDLGSRLINKDLLENRLNLHPEVPAKALIEALRHRAGLLQSQNSLDFEFAYRFEEFLAGCHLAKRKTGPNILPQFHRRALKLYRQQGDYARQPVLWAAGFNAHVVEGDEPTVVALVASLLFGADNPSADALSDLELAVAIARDAGMEKWHEILAPGAADTVRRLRERLIAVREDPDRFALAVRSRAASALGRLGDDRAGVGVLPKDERLPARPSFVWCGPDPKQPETPFPAGPFEMGGDAQAYGSSPEPFPCSRIVKPYFLSKYPVTVAQYQLFVEARGYENEALWTSAGRAWRTGKAETKDWPDGLRTEYGKERFPIAGPRNYRLEFQTANHPRVGISWYEALAYCRWLNGAFSPEALGLPGGGWKVRLPTDAEWERAARYPDGRHFPWGSEGSKEELTARCNWQESGLQQTSAVGLYPRGEAGCGAADMAGNVWEWCQSVWCPLDKAPERERYNTVTNAGKDLDLDTLLGERVLRGGSWVGDDPGNLRAALRFHYGPGYRRGNCGFRVVCGVESR